MTITEAKSKVSFTRPSSGNYDAKDAVAASTPSILTFYNLCVAGGGATIKKARLMTSLSTTTARFRLHLFNTSTGITAFTDGDPFVLSYASAAKRIGSIDFPMCQTEGTGSDAASALNDLVELSFSSVDGHLYGLLEILDAFTPGSGSQQFHIELSTE